MHVANRAMATSRTSLFQSATASWQKVPRPAWILALLSGALSASVDVAFWASGREIGWIYAAPLVLLAAIWLAAIYLGAIGIVGRAPTGKGYLTFLISSLVLLLPIALAIAVPILGKPVLTEGVRVSILVIGLLVGLAMISLLPAWPLAQAIAGRFIPPSQVFRATKGHRWSLVFISFALSGISNSKLIPEMSKASNIGEAILIGLGDTLMGLAVLGLTASIAATAWLFALRNDPTLS